MPQKGSKLKYGNRHHAYNKEFYKILKEKLEGKYSYSECKKIIEHCNSIVSEFIVSEDDGVKFTHGLGYICGVKFDAKRLQMDWQKFKQYGYPVYFMNHETAGKSVKVRWFTKRRIYISNFGNCYSFKPSRQLSRAMSGSFKRQPHKYQEWTVRDFAVRDRVHKTLNRHFKDR